MATKKVRMRVKREREVRTFAELSRANLVLLENSKEQSDGWFYECMGAILLSAFKIEAYLNHAGQALFPYWEEMERLPMKSKLSIICSHLGIEVKDGQRPFQTLHELFKFRNAIAHGKSEFLAQQEVIETGDLEDIRRKKPLTCWESKCTLAFAEQAHADTEAIIREIHSRTGLPEDELGRGGHGYQMKEADGSG